MPGKQSGGIRISRKMGKLGYRCLETVEVSYDNHRLGHDQLLGGEEGIGNGFRWALSALELGRINVAARGVGVAQAAYDAALAYAKEREAFGRPISQHQAIAFRLAEMATKLEAVRLRTYAAARKADAGERVDLAAGMATTVPAETGRGRA